MTSTEEILIRMGLDASAVQASMKSMTGKVSGMASTMGRNIAAAFTGGMILNGLNKVLDKFDQLQDKAENLGVGTDFLQGMSQIAKRDAVGGAAMFDKAISELSVRLGSAKDGSETAIKAFEKFGITLRDIENLDSQQMFYLISDRIKAIPDPAKRAAAAFELLGKSGNSLVGVLSNGSAELTKMVDAVDKLDAEKVKQLANAKGNIEYAENNLITLVGKKLGEIAERYKVLGRYSLGFEAEMRVWREDEFQKAKKVTAELRRQKELRQESATIASATFDMGKYQSLLRKYTAADYETTSIENIAGRDWSAQRAAMYGEGGAGDLGKGNGRFSAVAREYLSAKYAQQYARVYGTEQQAVAAQDRMGKARSILEAYGVKEPGADLEAMRGELEQMHALWRQVVSNGGIVINTGDK